jgi:zinc protease
MKKLIIGLCVALSVSITSFTAQAAEVIELKLSSSNKIVLKFMFRTGSIIDPKGKEGLTYATGNVVSGGGTNAMTYSEIQDRIYPMAAGYGASTDKQVTIFTFTVHQDFLKEFYPIVKGIMLNRIDFDAI